MYYFWMIGELNFLNSGNKACIFLVIATQLVISIQPSFCLGIKENRSPVFLEPIINVTIPAGRDVRLACVVDHLGSYKVAWIQQDRSAILTVGKHVITRNPRIGVMHDEHRTWYLNLRGVKPGDAGVYMCQINSEPVTSQVGVVNVVVPPYIKDEMTSKDVRLHEGASATLACSARGSPIPTIRWKREDGSLIKANGTIKKVEVPGPILRLFHVTRDDMGAYLCIASNGVPPSVSKRIKVEIKFRPKVYAPHQLVGVPLGQSVNIECFIEAWPKGLTYWIRPLGYEILHNDEKYNVSISQGSPSYKTHMLLTIRNVSYDDIGDYNCVANNSQGGADQVIRVSASAPMPMNPNSIEKRPTIKDQEYVSNNPINLEFGSNKLQNPRINSELPKSPLNTFHSFNQTTKILSTYPNEMYKNVILYPKNFTLDHQITSGSRIRRLALTIAVLVTMIQYFVLVC